MQLIRTDIASYDFIAFSNCNNNCSFCFQKNTENTRYISEDDVLKRLDILLQHIIENHATAKQINIDITGGELFYIPSLTSMYQKMFNRIKNVKEQIQKPIRCLIGTNLLYADTTLLYSTLDYVLRLDQDLLRGVFTSFDVVGRFRSLDGLLLFEKNSKDLFKYLHAHGVPLAFVAVLSRESMAHFRYPKTELDIEYHRFYDELYNQAKTICDPENGFWWLRLSWTTLSPNSLDDEYTKKMVPTVDDYVQFYKYLIDTYPVLAVVQSFFSSTKSLRCGNNCHVCKVNSVEKSCNTNIYGHEILKIENLHVESNDPIEIFKFLVARFGCMSCAYFDRCYIRQCPVVLNLKTVEIGEYCWRKKIYEYVESQK